MFLVYLGVILGYVVSKARKLPNPIYFSIIVNMHVPETPKGIHVYTGMA
jgi:hypothetical protein